MVPYNYTSTNEDYEQESNRYTYKEICKELKNELKEKFENHHSINKKLSDTEFNEMYEDYFHSGLVFDDYMNARKFR